MRHTLASLTCTHTASISIYMQQYLGAIPGSQPQLPACMMYTQRVMYTQRMRCVHTEYAARSPFVAHTFATLLHVLSPYFVGHSSTTLCCYPSFTNITTLSQQQHALTGRRCMPTRKTPSSCSIPHTILYAKQTFNGRIGRGVQGVLTHRKMEDMLHPVTMLLNMLLTMLKCDPTFSPCMLTTTYTARHLHQDMHPPLNNPPPKHPPNTPLQAWAPPSCSAACHTS